ncbi:MAG TPA: hypothetical protein DCQ28_10285 [Bacteroidetes bacterium]|jgi:uncharacterized membrane protein (DUF485 family)|nr:hypothetical protein [Bacteroidota bacterium]
MQHGPAVELGKDNSIPKKTKLGVILFIIYSTIYAGFVFIGTVSPEYMGAKIIGNMNFAFVYGMGLIILAVVMGVVYNHFCTSFENQMNGEVRS